ncbi:MAG: hypothetical protein NTY86_11585 [Deltaproteobacteria bacterium]|nr:hypothetical protein [Deltaproteobacteria bacterium]
MKMRYFGDSYDIVKLSLINWLGYLGDWSVHPMLTESATADKIAAYERFLGAQVLSSEVLTTVTDRSSYLACASECGHLFLDPDTGLKMKITAGAKAPEYLFASELEYIIKSRPNSLTLVFDQSHQRGNERSSLEKKLNILRSGGVYCFAYVSHACFIVGGNDENLVGKALSDVMEKSKLPESRFLHAALPNTHSRGRYAIKPPSSYPEPEH